MEKLDFKNMLNLQGGDDKEFREVDEPEPISVSSTSRDVEDGAGQGPRPQPLELSAVTGKDEPLPATGEEEKKEEGEGAVEDGSPTLPPEPCGGAGSSSGKPPEIPSIPRVVPTLVDSPPVVGGNIHKSGDHSLHREGVVGDFFAGGCQLPVHDNYDCGVFAQAFSQYRALDNISFKNSPAPGAGVPVTNPPYPYPVANRVSDWVYEQQGMWEESDSACMSTAHTYTAVMRLQGPAADVKTRGFRLLPSRVLDDSITMSKVQGAASGTAEQAVDFKSVKNALTSVLPGDGYASSTEKLTHVFVNRIAAVKRCDNSAFYFKLAANALAMQFYEESGVPTGAPAIPAIAGGHLIADLVPANQAAVLGCVHKISTMITEGRFVFIENVSVDHEDYLYIHAVTNSATVLIQPAAGQNPCVLNFLDMPVFDKLLGYIYITNPAAALAALPTAARAWALMFELASVRDEEVDCMRGLYLAVMHLTGAGVRDHYPGFGAAGTTYSLMAADLSTRVSYLVTPKSVNFVSQYLALATGGGNDYRCNDFPVVSSMTMAERWHTCGKIGFVVSASYTTALKELNFEGVVLDTILNSNHGFSAPADLTWAETAVIGGCNMLKPIDNGVCGLVKVASHVAKACYGYTLPYGVYAGATWGGAQRPSPTTTQPPTIGVPRRPRGCYTTQFNKVFPFSGHPASTVGDLLPGTMPANWNWMGTSNKMDLTSEVQMIQGTWRGVWFHRGDREWEKHLGDISVVQYRPYGPSMIAGLLLYTASQNFSGYSLSACPTGPGVVDADWQRITINNLQGYPVLNTDGRAVSPSFMPDNVYFPTFDYKLGRMTGYGYTVRTIAPAWNPIHATIAFQHREVSTTANGAWSVRRLANNRVDMDPPIPGGNSWLTSMFGGMKLPPGNGPPDPAPT